MNTQSPLVVLVVDDNAELLRGTCRLLDKAGYTTVPASSGAEALEYLRSNKPHIVLLDRQLPDVDGLEICRQLKANPATADLVFVVIVSAVLVEKEAQLDGLETGADGYITRPIANRELLVRIAPFARIARLTRKLSEEVEARRLLDAELEQRVRTRTAELEAANRSLEEGRRATLNLVEDAIRSRAEFSAANKSLRAEITKRQETETELTHAQVQLEEFFDLVPDLVCVASTDGYFKRLNPAWEIALGYSRAELMAQHFEHFVHPDDILPTREEVARQLKGQKTIQFQNRYRAKDGSYRWLEWQSTPAVGNVLYAAARDITDRKKAQEALIESERHFRTLADSGQALVWTSGVDKKCDYFNQPWLDFTGRTMEQELGDGWAEGVHPDDLQRCFEIYSGAFDRRERFSMVYRLRRADGEYRWIQDDGTPRFDVAGQFIGFIGQCLDITERQQLIESERREQALSQAIIESVPGAFYVLDAAGRFVRWNSYLRDEIVGLPDDQLSAMPALDTIHPDDRAIVHSKIEKVMQTGLEITVECRSLLKGGPDFRWFFHTGRRMVVAGEPFLVGFGLDLSERKQIEVSLRESEQRFRLLAEGTEDFVTLFDAEWRGIFNGPAYFRRTGWTQEDLDARDFTTRVHPDDLAAVKQARVKVAAGEAVTYEHRCRCKDGSWIWLETHIKQLPAPDGRMQYFSTSRDITKRRKAEDSLLVERQRLAAIIKGADVGTWEWNVVTGETVFNERWAGILGYTLAELEPVSVETWKQLAHPDDLLGSMALLERHFRGQLEIYECEQRMRHKDGSWVWIMDRGQLTARTPDGRPLLMQGVHIEITRLKQAEDALKQLNTELEQRVQERAAEVLDLYNNAPCGYHSVGPDGVVLQMNDTELGWLGYSREEVERRMRLLDLMTPASAALFDERFHNFRQKDAREVWEWEMRCRDGSTITILVNASAVRDAEGRFIRSRSAVLNITERKRLENTLRESEEKFRSIFETSPMPMHSYQLDDANRIVLIDSNPAASKVLGIPLQELLGKPIEEAFPYLKQTEIPQMYRDVALAKIGAQRFEVPYSDDRFSGYYTVNVFRTSHRTIVESFFDISDRRRAEEALQASEQRLRDIIGTIPDFVWEVDERSVYTFASPQCQALLGCEPKEVLGRTPFSFHAPEEAERIAQIAQPIMAKGEPIRGLESAVYHKDGRLVFVETNGVPIFDASGKLRGYRGLDHNITERRRAEVQLRQLHSAVEQSSTAVMITDRSGTIEYVNPQFEAQTGYDAAEVIGKNPRILQSGHHTIEFYQHMWGILRAGQVWRGELCNKRKDGAIYWESTSIAPIRDRSGKLTHYVAIKEDVTDRRLLMDELRQAKEAADAANRAKGIFLANMSHEIRTPLNAVLGFAQLMQRDATLTAVQRQRMESINRNGNHLLQLISDVLDMARIESGRVQLAPSDCNFRALVQDTHATFRLRAEEKRLRFDLQVSDEVPTHLHTDAVRVRQVLINMLGNAIKFTTEGGISLRVTAEPAQYSGPAAARLCLEVDDTGVGIAAGEVGKVFTAFEQTLSGQREGTGTGLGMAISRQLARLLGGDLTVASQPGVGSTFRFTFVAIVQSPGLAPLAGAVAQDGIVKLQPGVPPPKVLVVDDIASNREILRTLLESAGFIVEEAPDGAEAVEHCAAHPPALVLMDRRMPGMDGLTAIRAIRSGPAGRDTRILVVSADLLGTAEEEWKEAGADGFLSKPFQMEAVLTRVGELLKLKYVTAEPAAALAETPSDASSATRDLPPKVRADLRRAIESGDINGLRKILEKTVVPLNHSLGKKLGRLADNYDYTGIMQALKE